MTLDIRKELPAITGVRLKTASLPKDLQEQARRRLARVGFALAALFVIAAIMLELLSPGSLRDWQRLSSVVIRILLSFTIGAVAWRTPLSTPTVLRLGLAYAVLLCFLTSLESTRLQLESGDFGSLTWTAPLIIVFPLLIPSTSRTALVVAILCGATRPLSLGFMHLFGLANPKVMDYPMSSFHVAIAVCIAYFGSRIIYGMGTELGRAQAMGSYTLESVLGEGGMGEVWRAKHALLARPAALKLIRPSMLENLDPSVARGYKVRFEREAQVTANLQSPHTVELFDFGTTSDGTFYYAMELLDGLDMHSLVQRYGPVPPERAIWFLLQACHSLGEAHRAGLVHRDIKPANLMVCVYGGDADFVKVLDFGVVAQAPERRDPSQDQLTTVGAIAGTPQYMSPEVARGHQADASSDIYALGCVAYMLLSGHKVFYEPTPQAVLAAHAYKSPKPLKGVSHQELPEPLIEVVMSCLEKEKEHRPRSAEELARQLGDIDLASPWSQERARRWWERCRPLAVEGDHRPNPLVSGSDTAALPQPEPPEGGSSPTIQETPAKLNDSGEGKG